LNSKPCISLIQGFIILYSSLSIKFVKTSYMEEVIFFIEESPEGGYTSKGLSASLYTEANTMEQLREL